MCCRTIKVWTSGSGWGEKGSIGASQRVTAGSFYLVRRGATRGSASSGPASTDLLANKEIVRIFRSLSNAWAPWTRSKARSFIRPSSYIQKIE